MLKHKLTHPKLKTKTYDLTKNKLKLKLTKSTKNKFGKILQLLNLLMMPVSSGVSG
jgi:hypothetical protein